MAETVFSIILGIIALFISFFATKIVLFGIIYHFYKEIHNADCESGNWFREFNEEQTKLVGKYLNISGGVVVLLLIYLFLK